MRKYVEENITSWSVFIIALTTYVLTIEPTNSFWDCGEYIATAYKLQVGHPPGAPLFLILGNLFSQFAFGNTEKNSFMGLIFGLASALGFSIFSVSLRWRKETPKFTTVAFAGIFCAVVSTIILINSNSNFLSSSYNEGLFAIHGSLVCMGLVLYSIGSKTIQAAELTLLSLTEVIGGIFWVWLPLFGINEVPSTNTIVGGFFIFISLVYYSLIMRWNKRYIALN